MKVFGVTIKHDRVTMPQLSRLTIQNADRFHKGNIAGLSLYGRAVGINHPHRLCRTGRRQNVVGFDFGTIIQKYRGRSPVALANLLNPRTKFQMPAQRFEVLHQPLQDESNPVERPTESFVENALEHNHELAEIHISRRRAAVKHQRAEQHVDQQRVANIFRNNLTS